jgi:Zn-dependent protease
VLIVVHEFGHAAAAFVAGLKVEAIVLAGLGGWCVVSPQPWPTPARALLLHAGGLIAQLAAFTVTVAVLYVFGAPRQTWLAAGAIVLTAGNMFLLLGNAIPSGKNDGAQIRDAFRQWRSDDA